MPRGMRSASYTRAKPEVSMIEKMRWAAARGEERKRLDEARARGVPWRKWGPYLSERQWGTVREDYSIDGNAWAYLPHDHARSRA